MSKETSLDEKTNDAEAVHEETTTERVPPHTCLPVWIDRFFDAIRDLNTPLITREFISANVVSSGHQGKVLIALRFLWLLDQNGNVTPRLRALRVIGPEFTTNLAIVVQQAYSGLLGTVVVKSASFNSLVNFLMQRYSMNKDQASSAGRFFVHLASRAGMELSEELSKLEVAKSAPSVRSEHLARSVSTRERVSSDGTKNQDSALATISSRFGEIRVIDKPSLQLARKLLEIIDSQIPAEEGDA